MAIKLSVGNEKANLHVDGDNANLKAGGTITAIKNYNLLTNKPQINGVELIGNKSFEELGLDVATTENNGLMSAEDKRRLLKTTECYELHITIVQQTETGVQFSIPQAEHTAIIQAYNNHDNFAILLNVTINSVNYSLVAFPCRIEQLFNFNAILFSVPSKDNGLAATTFFTVGLSVQYPSGVVAINTVDFELQNYLIGQKEDKSNKVQSITSESTASEYPSAKAVYDSIENVIEQMPQKPFIVTATQWEQPGAEDTYTLDNATFNDIAYAIYNGRNVFIRTMSDTFPFSNLIYDAESNRWAYVFGGTIASGGMIINKFFIVLNNPGNIGTLISNSETFVGTVNGQSGYVTLTAEDVGALPNTTVIGDGTLTIQKNGASVGTFSANTTANETINITVPVTAADVSALPASTKYGASISVSINSTDYKITTTLKDQDGNTLGTAQVIDLPLESVVVSGSYDAQNKKIILTLQNGTTIDIPVGDLVAGLQTEITAQAPLNADLVSDSTSTHKFTTAANLTKLAGIEAGAEVNVQPDWSQTNSAEDDFIKNKPTKTSDFQNDGADGTAAYLETDETAYRTAAIPWGKVDSTSTNKLFTATIPGITEYRDGVSFWLKNGVVTSTTGFTVNINGLGGKKCYNNMTAATQDTTIFNVAYTMLFVYDETLDSGAGGFYIYRGYDANTNTIGYQLRTNSSVLKTTDACRYYKIFFTSADGTHWVPASANATNNATSARPVNQRPINPFGEIVYCSANTNYAAEADIGATTIWEQYALTLGYSFNRTGAALELTTKRPVYVKCAPQADGSAIMDADEPIVQSLPSTDDGKIYIFLGIAYSATAIEIVPMHPVYYFKDGAVRIWTGAATSAVQTLTDAEIDAICVR